MLIHPNDMFLIKTPTSKGQLGLMAQYMSVLSVIAELSDNTIRNVNVLVDFRTEALYKNPMNPNSWECFFQQPRIRRTHEELPAIDIISPTPYSLSDVLAAIESGELTNYKISEFNECAHVFGYYKGTMDWNDVFVSRSQYAAMSIDLQPWIHAIVGHFHFKHMVGRRILGVQRRNTDCWTTGHGRGQSFDIWDHFRIVEKHLDDYDAFLLVTDDLRSLEMFRARYGARMIHYDAVELSRHGLPSHKDAGIDNYKKGEDVLVETCLLSRCDYLLAMSSNISSAARAMNDELRYEFVDRHITYE